MRVEFFSTAIVIAAPPIVCFGRSSIRFSIGMNRGSRVQDCSDAFVLTLGIGQSQLKGKLMVRIESFTPGSSVQRLVHFVPESIPKVRGQTNRSGVARIHGREFWVLGE